MPEYEGERSFDATDDFCYAGSWLTQNIEQCFAIALPRLDSQTSKDLTCRFQNYAYTCLAKARSGNDYISLWCGDLI